MLIMNNEKCKSMYNIFLVLYNICQHYIIRVDCKQQLIMFSSLTVSETSNNLLLPLIAIWCTNMFFDFLRLEKNYSLIIST